MRMPSSRTIRILTLSRDVSLLSSRANLLTQAGYSADCELDQERALRRIRTRGYDLIIVSDSFSPDEQVALRAKVRQLEPDTAVLLLGEEAKDAGQLLELVEASLEKKNNIRARLRPFHSLSERKV